MGKDPKLRLRFCCCVQQSLCVHKSMWRRIAAFLTFCPKNLREPPSDGYLHCFQRSEERRGFNTKRQIPGRQKEQHIRPLRALLFEDCLPMDFFFCPILCSCASLYFQIYFPLLLVLPAKEITLIHCYDWQSPHPHLLFFRWLRICP